MSLAKQEFFDGVVLMKCPDERKALAFQIAKRTLAEIEQSVQDIQWYHDPGPSGDISESHCETGFLCKEYIKMYEASVNFHLDKSDE